MRSQRDANLFAAAMASRRCVCCKAHLYLQIECGQATWSALPRRNSICGKQSAAEYSREPARCKLVCNCNGFSQMCVLQGTLISPNKIRQATGSAMPRRHSICGKQSADEYTRKFKHLNRDRIRKIHCNLLKNFPLQGFNKHPRRFRCSGKGEHLNLASRQNPAAKPLTTNALQGFQKLYPRFRSQAGLECRGMQTCPGGASGWGIRQTRSRVAQASEPEQNPKNPLQHIEKLSVAGFQQASPPVQMQRKRRVSEPCSKAESGSQTAHNKRVAGLSATVPEVQIPDGFGTPRNANVPCRCFLQGYPPNARQHCPRI